MGGRRHPQGLRAGELAFGRGLGNDAPRLAYSAALTASVGAQVTAPDNQGAPLETALTPQALLRHYGEQLRAEGREAVVLREDATLLRAFALEHGGTRYTLILSVHTDGDGLATVFGCSMCSSADHGVEGHAKFTTISLGYAVTLREATL